MSSDVRTAPSTCLVLWDVIRQAVDAAARHDIAVGARQDGDGGMGGALVETTVDTVRRAMAARQDREELRSPRPWRGTLAKRASELHRFPQLIPFVHRILVDAHRLAEPVAIDVRTIASDLPPRRSASGVGQKQIGLAAIALHRGSLIQDAALTYGAGWSAIDYGHVIGPDTRPGGDAAVEEPLDLLLQALVAAHATTPVLVNALLWPFRAEGIAFRARHPDIERQLERYGAHPLICRSAPPHNLLYFSDIGQSELAPGLAFEGRENTQLTVRMVDAFGRQSYFKAPAKAPRKRVIDGIAAVEREREGLAVFAKQFADCGVMGGNATSSTAIAVRAACVQIADLLLEAGVTACQG